MLLASHRHETRESLGQHLSGFGFARVFPGTAHDSRLEDARLHEQIKQVTQPHRALGIQQALRGFNDLACPGGTGTTHAMVTLLFSAHWSRYLTRRTGIEPLL